jgi:hypothetical protein
VDAWEKARVLLVVSAVAAVALVLTAIVALFTVPHNGRGGAVTPTQTPALTPTAPPTDGAGPMGRVSLEGWIPIQGLQGHPGSIWPPAE